MLKRKMPLVHPGIILREEVIKPSNHTIGFAAHLLAIHPTELKDINEGLSPITQAIAENIASYYGGEADIWVRLQKAYDTDEVRLNQNPT